MHVVGQTLTLYTMSSALFVLLLFQLHWDTHSHAALCEFQGFLDGAGVENPPANSGDTRDFGKIPWRRKWHPTPGFWAGKCHGWRSLVGYSPGVMQSGTWLSTHTHCVSWRCTARWFWCSKGNDLHSKFSEHPSPHRHMWWGFWGLTLNPHVQHTEVLIICIRLHVTPKTLCTVKRNNFICQLYRIKAGETYK